MCHLFLSVVIISKNEEKNIANCIESVLEAIKDIQNSEVILVDSASTDTTIDIAKKYPIKILQLDPSWPLSAASGRYIGFLHSHGKYIQFQDGDTLLDKDWILHAIPILEENKIVAGVVGIIEQKEFDSVLSKNIADYELRKKIDEVNDYQEDALFKRDILLEVGSFNPFMVAQEEGELAERIVDKGYKLMRLPFKMSNHLGGQKGSYFDIIKIRPKYAIGKGQKLRLSFNNNRIFWLRVKEHKFLLIFLLLIIDLIIIFVLFSKNTYLFYIFISFMMVFIGLIFYEKRNIKSTIIHILSLAIQSPYFVLGLLRPMPDIKTYPTDVKIIQE